MDQVEQEVSRLEEMVEEFEDAILDPEDLILQPKMLINRAISFMSKSRQNIAGNRDLAAISKSKPRTKLQLLEHVCSSKINLSFPNLDDIEPQ